MSEPPIIPDYHAGKIPPPPLRPVRSMGRFVLGLLVGAIFSILGYIVIGQTAGPQGLYLMLCVPVAKIVAGAIIIGIYPRWRSFGSGLIVSIPLLVVVSVGWVFYVCTHTNFLVPRPTTPPPAPTITVPPIPFPGQTPTTS